MFSFCFSGRKAGPERDYLVRMHSSQVLKTVGFRAERPLGYLLTQQAEGKILGRRGGDNRP